MSELKWTTQLPSRDGWYWIKWREARNGENAVRMWYFDGSEDDVNTLRTRAVLFYGPLEPPEDDE